MIMSRRLASSPCVEVLQGAEEAQGDAPAAAGPLRALAEPAAARGHRGHRPEWRFPRV